MDVETGLLGGSALVMLFVGLSSPSKHFLIFSVGFFMFTECCTLAFHVDLNSCISHGVKGYFVLYSVSLALLLLGLIISFLILLKNYTELMLKINEFSKYTE